MGRWKALTLRKAVEETNEELAEMAMRLRKKVRAMEAMFGQTKMVKSLRSDADKLQNRVDRNRLAL